MFFFVCLSAVVVGGGGLVLVWFFWEEEVVRVGFGKEKKNSFQLKTRHLGFAGKRVWKGSELLRPSYQVSWWCQVCFLRNIWTNFTSGPSLGLFTTWILVEASGGGSQTCTSEILSIWSTTWVGKALWWQGWGADRRCCCEKDGISRAVIKIARSGCSRYFSKCQLHEDLKECAKKHVACSSWSKSGLSGSLSITAPPANHGLGHPGLFPARPWPDALLYNCAEIGWTTMVFKALFHGALAVVRFPKRQLPRLCSFPLAFNL